MKSISIYALTRKQNTACLSRLEHQLSGREKPLKIRTWELNSMRAFVDHLEEHMPEVYRLRFFYSFQIPRLGKEFDLLQVKEKQIVNLAIERVKKVFGAEYANVQPHSGAQANAAVLL